MRRPAIAVIVGIVLLAAILLFLRTSQSKPVVRQPVAFPHRTHLANEIECVFCHSAVEVSESAGLPSVTQCMVCHQSTKTEDPEIQKLAAFANRGEDVPWVRIYEFERSAAVRFSHKRHLKAGVECSLCHGNLAEAVETRREIHWTMGKCIDCHRSRQASIDCLVCHK
ncbi:MAG: cytochrome c family protein [Acidobacteria bacterium]|nr:cytochrome c family protein [Acidobacteriota bacterium]